MAPKWIKDEADSEMRERGELVRSELVKHRFSTIVWHSVGSSAIQHAVSSEGRKCSL